MATRAKQAYEVNSEEALYKLNQIRGMVKAHEPKTTTIHWGHVGDLEHVNDALAEIIAFLTGEEGVIGADLSPIDFAYRT